MTEFLTDLDMFYLGTADAEVAGECSTALELASVEQQLAVLCQLQRIAAFFWNRFCLWIWVNGTVPGENSDDSCST